MRAAPTKPAQEDALRRRLASLARELGGTLWPLGWPALAQLALALVLAELGHYTFHRISHEWSWVWPLHAPHHSAPRLYWLNATRFNILDLFCLLSFQALAVDRARRGSRGISVVHGRRRRLRAAATWQNRAAHGAARLDLQHARAAPLHHSPAARESNHNYGAILSCWDLLFASLWRPRDREFSGPVGIAALPRFSAGYLGQQLAPFRWARIRRENAAANAGAAR